MSGSFIARSGSLVVPASVVTYSQFDHIANTATAGSVVPITLPEMVRSDGAGFRCDGCRLSKSGAVLTNAQFRVLIWDSVPVFSAGDDAQLLNGSVYAVDDIRRLLAIFDVSINRAGTVGASSDLIAPTNVGARTLRPAAGLDLFATIMANAGYQRASGETFTVTLEGVRG
jgi:hypothetical protein